MIEITKTTHRISEKTQSSHFLLPQVKLEKQGEMSRLVSVPAVPSSSEPNFRQRITNVFKLATVYLEHTSTTIKSLVGLVTILLCPISLLVAAIVAIAAGIFRNVSEHSNETVNQFKKNIEVARLSQLKTSLNSNGSLIGFGDFLKKHESGSAEKRSVALELRKSLGSAKKLFDSILERCKEKMAEGGVIASRIDQIKRARVTASLYAPSVVALARDLEKGEATPEELRQKIVSLMQDPLYTLFQSKSHPGVDFLNSALKYVEELFESENKAAIELYELILERCQGQGVEKGISVEEASRYAKAVVTFARDLKKGKGSSEEFHERIVTLMKSPCYYNFQSEHHLDVDFLQHCALNLLRADGTKACETYGKAVFGQYYEGQNEFSFNDVADALDKHLNEYAYDRDNVGHNMIWAVNNYDAAARTIQNRSKRNSLNSYDQNVPFIGMPLDVNGKNIVNLIGPNPTGPLSIYENGVLEAYRKLGVKEIRNTHQSPHNTQESALIVTAHGWQDKNRDVFGHNVFSFDTFVESDEGKRLKGEYEKNHDLNQFLDKYDKYIIQNRDQLKMGKKGAKAITIPENVLGEAKLREAIDKAREVVETCRFAIMIQPKEQAIDTVLRIYDHILMRAILEENTPDYFASPCKQHFDRGVANSILTYYIDKIVNTGQAKLTKEEFFTLLGLRARPHAAENRAPYKERIQQAIQAIRAMAPHVEEIQNILAGNTPNGMRRKLIQHVEKQLDSFKKTNSGMSGKEHERQIAYFNQRMSDYKGLSLKEVEGEFANEFPEEFLRLQLMKNPSSDSISGRRLLKEKWTQELQKTLSVYEKKYEEAQRAMEAIKDLKKQGIKVKLFENLTPEYIQKQIDEIREKMRSIELLELDDDVAFSRGRSQEIGSSTPSSF